VLQCHRSSGRRRAGAAARRKHVLEPLIDSPHFAAVALCSECLAVPSGRWAAWNGRLRLQPLWPAIGIPPLVYQRRRGSTPRWAGRGRLPPRRLSKVRSRQKPRTRRPNGPYLPSRTSHQCPILPRRLAKSPSCARRGLLSGRECVRLCVQGVWAPRGSSVTGVGTRLGPSSPLLCLRRVSRQQSVTDVKSGQKW
jgi:hypothetical protein